MMYALVKWTPRLILGTAVIHLAYGILEPNVSRGLSQIAGAGVINSVNGQPEREAWLWFMLTGVTWLALGDFANASVRRTGHLPPRLGFWLLAIAVPLTVMSPISGGWLVASIGIFALLDNLRHRLPARRAAAHASG